MADLNDFTKSHQLHESARSEHGVVEHEDGGAPPVADGTKIAQNQQVAVCAVEEVEVAKHLGQNDGPDAASPLGQADDARNHSPNAFAGEQGEVGCHSPADAQVDTQKNPIWPIVAKGKNCNIGEINDLIVRVVNKVSYDSQWREEHCKEAIQQTWVALLQASHLSPQNPTAWICTIAYNEAARVSKAAKNRSSQLPLMDEESIEREAAQADMSQSIAEREAVERCSLLWKVLYGTLDDDGSKTMWKLLTSKLNDDQCRFLELAKARLKIEQIAVAMRISLSTTYRLQKQVTKVLQAFVSGLDDDPPNGPAGPGRGRRTHAGTATTAAFETHAGGPRVRGTRAQQQFLDQIFGLPAFATSEQDTSAVAGGNEEPHFSELFDLPAFKQAGIPSADAGGTSVAGLYTAESVLASLASFPDSPIELRSNLWWRGITSLYNYTAESVLYASESILAPSPDSSTKLRRNLLSFLIAMDLSNKSYETSIALAKMACQQAETAVLALTNWGWYGSGQLDDTPNVFLDDHVAPAPTFFCHGARFSVVDRPARTTTNESRHFVKTATNITRQVAELPWLIANVYTGHNSWFDGINGTVASASREQNEAVALHLVKEGEYRTAIELLMKTQGDVVYAFCLRILKNPTLADDVRQDVFVEAYRGLATFVGGSSLRTWLLGIARYRALNALRAVRREAARVEFDDGLLAEATSDRPDPREKSEPVSAGSQLESCLKSCVSAEERHLILLHYRDGLSYEEMGNMLGKKADTLRARVTRALPKLRRHLERQRSGVSN